MNFRYITDRLSLEILDEDSADKILNFYYTGREAFIPKEAKKPDKFYTLSYQEALAKCEYNAFLDGEYARYFVFLYDDPSTIIGTVSFGQFVPTPYESCIIGYKFLPEYQKKGYATEAVRTLVNEIFETKKIHRIEAFCLPDNTASINLLERTGFEFEAVAKSVLKLNDGYHDHLRYVQINPRDRE